MRLPKIPDSGPKKKLLDATERLVVEKGFDLVSVRDITEASKANVAAVNYHFGSREGLMDLIAYHVMEPLNCERTKALEAAKNSSGKNGPSAESLLDAYLKPLLTTASDLKMDVRFYLKLVGRVLILPDDIIYPSLASDRAAVSDRFLETLSESLPKSPATDWNFTWRFFENGLGQSLVALRNDSDPGESLAAWISFALQGFGNSKDKSHKPKKRGDQTLLLDFQ